MMTKKDYREFARIINESRKKVMMVEYIRDEIAKWCKQDNPNFDEQLFIAASDDK